MFFDSVAQLVEQVTVMIGFWVRVSTESQKNNQTHIICVWLFF